MKPRKTKAVRDGWDSIRAKIEASLTDMQEEQWGPYADENPEAIKYAEDIYAAIRWIDSRI